MELELLCPFHAATLVWEVQAGEWNLTACVKATFSLVSGRVSGIAARQVPICEDLYWDRDPKASLYAPSDFVPMKPRADILLVGHAYAPGGVPVESLVARMRVGELSKAVTVVGDRAWMATPGGVRPGPTTPFVRMPLRYERAPRSPEHGLGIDSSLPPQQVGRPLPNLHIDDAGGALARTAGFGPIAPLWRARRRNLEDAATRWLFQLRGQPGPAPPGFDFSVFNAAPQDQLVDWIQPSALIALENLHPSLPRIETRLLPVRPRAFRVSPRTGLSFELGLRCDTLWIDADSGTATLVWRGTAPVRGRDEQALGKLVVTAEFDDAAPHGEATKPAVVWPKAPASGSPPTVRLPSAEMKQDITQSPLSSAEARSLLPSGWAAAGPSQADGRPAVLGTGSREGLPFKLGEVTPQGQMPAPKPPAPAPAPRAVDDVTTFLGERGAPAAKDVLPFVTAATGAGQPSASLSSAWPVPASVAKAPAPQRESSILSDVTQPPRAEDATKALLEARSPVRSVLPFKPAATPAGQAEESPSVLSSNLTGFGGSAAPSAPVASTIDRPGRTLTAGPVPTGDATLAESSKAEPKTAASSVLGVTIEQCATVSAELADKSVPRDQVLRAHGLTEATWSEADRRWAEAMSKESDSGSGMLLSAFDTAYVAAVERLRGPIAIDEYARLKVGIERGNARPALAELRIQRAALMRIERVWVNRIAKDPLLAASVNAALDVERLR